MPSDDVSSQNMPSHVTFNYIKSSLFRVIHVDGAIGGITPRGLIHCSIYSERAAIPRITRQPLNADGTLGDQEIVESREGVAREMEVDLIFDERTAKELYDWLGGRLEKLAAVRKESS
jgi:hypothetical protein